MENSATLASTPWSHGLSRPNPPHPSGTNDVTKVTWQTEKRTMRHSSIPLLEGETNGCSLGHRVTSRNIFLFFFVRSIDRAMKEFHSANSSAHSLRL
ncbi:hypothetical protein CEXT_219581 [Caerostris extrusa]|uniref:Uncharacterized protein n=1 Tax=Caerostris extrusa TaxID=172846 RepID=A0AAV4VFG4_CAEEX|nr:hypothetical protein CEXT_219581 [Caerostris extrusa]